MSFDAAAVAALFSRVQSHAMDSGLFETVNLHESRNAPGRGLHTSIWVDYLGPAPAQSGLAATTGVVVLKARIYSAMLQEPLDAIDPEILTAASTLLSEYTGDFDLGQTVRNIDLLGQTGRRLEAQAGYAEIAKKMSRIFDITVPVIINDMWTQAG